MPIGDSSIVGAFAGLEIRVIAIWPFEKIKYMILSCYHSLQRSVRY